MEKITFGEKFQKGEGWYIIPVISDGKVIDHIHESRLIDGRVCHYSFEGDGHTLWFFVEDHGLPNTKVTRSGGLAAIKEHVREFHKERFALIENDSAWDQRMEDCWAEVERLCEAFPCEEVLDAISTMRVAGFNQINQDCKKGLHPRFLNAAGDEIVTLFENGKVRYWQVQRERDQAFLSFDSAEKALAFCATEEISK